MQLSKNKSWVCKFENNRTTKKKVVRFSKIQSWVHKVENHRTTKKKKKEVLRAFTPPKIFFTPILKFLLSPSKKFYTASKNFTPSWIARIAAYSMSAYLFSSFRWIRSHRTYSSPFYIDTGLSV